MVQASMVISGNERKQKKLIYFSKLFLQTGAEVGGR